MPWVSCFGTLAGSHDGGGQFVRVAAGRADVGGLDRVDAAGGLDVEVAALLAAVTGKPVEAAKVADETGSEEITP